MFEVAALEKLPKMKNHPMTLRANPGDVVFISSRART
jgi:hypothetical protein